MRVSTAEQADSGLGLSSQRAAIEAECARRGWTLVEVYEDAGISGKTLNRPGVEAALVAVESGQVANLVLAKLDRLSRSLVDFAGLMARAQRGGWNLVALDLGIDLSTPAGEFMASVMASAAQWERRIIGQRTRDALAIKKSQGAVLGRPTSSVVDTAVRERIFKAHLDSVESGTGPGWSNISRTLNAEGVPTAHGAGKWHPSTVRAIAVLAAQ